MIGVFRPVWTPFTDDYSSGICVQDHKLKLAMSRSSAGLGLRPQAKASGVQAISWGGICIMCARCAGVL